MINIWFLMVMKIINNFLINRKLKNEGFCFTPIIFSEIKIEKVKKSLWEVIQGKYETGVPPETRFWEIGDDPEKIIKIDKPHLSDKNIWNLITEEKFGNTLAAVTASNLVQVWHSQAVWKPPGGGQKGNAGWHRDIQYWPFWKEHGVYTAWIALTDVFEESGPVRYAKKSHNWEHINKLDFFDSDINNQDLEINKKHQNYEVVNATLKKGSVSIHASKTYHSSTENNSNSPRVGLVVHFCTDKSIKAKLVGKHSNYLDNLNDEIICPIIYKK